MKIFTVDHVNYFCVLYTVYEHTFHFSLLQVKVGPDVTLPQGTLLTRVKPSGQADSDEFQDTSPRVGDAAGAMDETAVDSQLLGVGGEGYLWSLGMGDEDELVQQMLGESLVEFKGWGIVESLINTKGDVLISKAEQ